LKKKPGSTAGRLPCALGQGGFAAEPYLLKLTMINTEASTIYQHQFSITEIFAMNTKLPIKIIGLTEHKGV
jgi:hypothetical protein